MIQANELRIGNYAFIKWSNEYRKLDILDIKDIAENKDYIGEQAEPIALTSSILEKAGLFIEDEAYHAKGSNYWFEIYHGIDEEYFYYKATEFKITPLYFLHQLQNLYFALVGQELPITL